MNMPRNVAWLVSQWNWPAWISVSWSQWGGEDYLTTSAACRIEREKFTGRLSAQAVISDPENTSQEMSAVSQGNDIAMIRLPAGRPVALCTRLCTPNARSEMSHTHITDTLGLLAIAGNQVVAATFVFSCHFQLMHHKPLLITGFATQSPTTMRQHWGWLVAKWFSVQYLTQIGAGDLPLNCVKTIVWNRSCRHLCLWLLLAFFCLFLTAYFWTRW